jgi:hypothetical protein
VRGEALELRFGCGAYSKHLRSRGPLTVGVGGWRLSFGRCWEEVLLFYGMPHAIASTQHRHQQ